MYTGPCSVWPVECCCDLDNYNESTLEIVQRAASEILWAASGRQFGECAITAWPCRDECFDTPYRYGIPGYGDTGQWPNPALIGGVWYNLGCVGSCHGGCSCNEVDQFTLPDNAVRVTDITIDGVALPTGSYMLQSNRFVVRTDGDEWPRCNDLTQLSGEGTWTVTFVVGNEVPALGKLAAGELMCELLKACKDDDGCVLPANLQSLTRQGVAQNFIDPREFMADGFTGIYNVDLFVRTFNPNGLTSRSRSYSPDAPDSRRVSV